jgi:molybdate transport system substrate-binding protein
MRLRLLGLVALLLSGSTTALAAEPARVLAAFTLKPALDQIAVDYKTGGGEVTLIYGPSPGLAQQVENGLAADLFFSADRCGPTNSQRITSSKPDPLPI